MLTVNWITNWNRYHYYQKISKGPGGACVRRRGAPVTRHNGTMASPSLEWKLLSDAENLHASLFSAGAIQPVLQCVGWIAPVLYCCCCCSCCCCHGCTRCCCFCCSWCSSYSAEGKVHHTPLRKHRRVLISLSLPRAHRWRTTNVCDMASATPDLRLPPSCKASLPIDWYQIILHGDRGTCIWLKNKVKVGRKIVCNCQINNQIWFINFQHQIK